MTLLYIIIFSVIGSLIAMTGGMLLVSREKLLKNVAHLFMSFGAGVLLGVGFLKLMYKSANKFGDFYPALFWGVIGVVLFFITEKLLWWHHHHVKAVKKGAEEDDMKQSNGGGQSKYMILIGDAMHNFIDGIVIAVSFIADFSLGVSASLGIIFHEMPQEIVDFGTLYIYGMKKSRVFLLNFISAFSTVVAAVITYFVADYIGGILPVILAIAAGNFIYIASSDLIPDIHHYDSEGPILQVLLFLLGIAFVIFVL